MKRLWAISDVHVGYKVNRQAIKDISPRPNDWLIIAGDVGENPEHLQFCLDELLEKFEKLIWVPGNHELYCTRNDPCQLRGEERYRHYVDLCRERGVLTPEDPYIQWPGEGPKRLIVPLFLLYDYSFGPDGFTVAETLEWSKAFNIVASDERLLYPAPYASREDWCQARVRYTQGRLAELNGDEQLIFVNHYPFRRDLIRFRKLYRFIPWCGTRSTEDWHEKYPAEVVVSGHLHMRATDWKGGTRFEEVSLGYPRHWDQEKGVNHYVREVLPGPPMSEGPDAGPIWRF